MLRKNNYTINNASFESSKISIVHFFSYYVFFCLKKYIQSNAVDAVLFINVSCVFFSFQSFCLSVHLGPPTILVSKESIEECVLISPATCAASLLCDLKARRESSFDGKLGMSNILKTRKR